MRHKIKAKIKDRKPSVFNKLIRIRKSQLDFIKKVKLNYSAAGYLDMIINQWKYEYGEDILIAQGKKFQRRYKKK